MILDDAEKDIEIDLGEEINGEFQAKYNSDKEYKKII